MIVETDGDVQVKLGGWDLAAEGQTEEAPFNPFGFLKFAQSDAEDEPKIKFDCLPKDLVKTLMKPKYYEYCFEKSLNAYEDSKVFVWFFL